MPLDEQLFSRAANYLRSQFKHPDAAIRSLVRPLGISLDTDAAFVDPSV